MKTIVYVYGFLQIKYSLYSIDNVLLQRYLFSVDYNMVLISNILVAMVTDGKLCMIMPKQPQNLQKQCMFLLPLLFAR